jgi:hypothetical protein
MKPLLKFVGFLVLANFLWNGLSAQQPFRPPSFPPRPYIPRRIILLERIERPALLKISEQQIIHGSVKRDTSTEWIKTRIMRIRGDSVYFESEGYLFQDIESLDLPNFNHYRKSDSLNWRIIFPPDDIYRDRESYSSYMREVTIQFKKQRLPSRSCRSFNNMLKFNITKILNVEIAFAYERKITNRWALEIETGYQFAVADPMSDDFFLGMYPLYKYSGVNVVAGPKFYPGKVGYLQLIIVYHYLDMDLSRTKSANSSRDYGLQYQYRNDVGGGLRFGIVTRASRSMVVDSYIGLGLKACMINQFIYGTYPEDDSENYFHWYNADHSAENNHVTLLMPVISLGIKIGIGF